LRSASVLAFTGENVGPDQAFKSAIDDLLGIWLEIASETWRAISARWLGGLFASEKELISERESRPGDPAWLGGNTLSS